VMLPRLAVLAVELTVAVVMVIFLFRP